MADRVGRNTGNAGAPFGILGVAVAFPEQVAAECLEADAITRYKRGIMPVLNDERVRHTEHQRRVCIGANWNPIRLEKIRGVCLERANHHKANAGLFRAPQPRLKHVCTGAA